MLIRAPPFNLDRFFSPPSTEKVGALRLYSFVDRAHARVVREACGGPLQCFSSKEIPVTKGEKYESNQVIRPNEAN
jgi:hypothetical protein